VALHVALVSPERVLYTGEAEMVICRAAGGDIAFLTGHAPFLGALGIGVVRIRPAEGGDEVEAAVHGGFVEVSNDRVTILSDVAELKDQIDVERARAAQQRAERREADMDDAEAEAMMRRASVRLQVAGAA
jgi:F-type H+-transporting ATPase subunit epsilon